MVPMARITKRAAEAFEAVKGKEATLWDTELRGLGLRAWPSGKKVFVLKYRNGHGRQRKLTLGPFGAMTCEQARSLARAYLGEIAGGVDPAERNGASQNSVLISAHFQRYLNEHALPKKRAKSVASDRSLFRLYIAPRLGRTPVSAITREDVERLHLSLAHTPTTANRVRSLLSKLFSLAERWGLREPNSNPCKHLEKFPEKARHRYLSQVEIARFLRTLDSLETSGKERSVIVDALRLLLLTGCRLNEVLTLRWPYIDFDNQCIHLPEAKAGQRTVLLSAEAISVLLRRQAECRSEQHFVFPGQKQGSHLVNLQKAWERIRPICGLDDVRLHDLRHTYASLAAASGMSLPMIGRLLGHHSPLTTQRYAHLADSSLRKGAESIGKILASIK